MVIVQFLIAFIGVVAVFLANCKDVRYRRIAPIVGLCGQPLWVILFVVDQRWIMLFVTALYTFSWCKGIWTYWIMPWRTREHHCSNCGTKHERRHLIGCHGGLMICVDCLSEF